MSANVYVPLESEGVHPRTTKSHVARNAAGPLFANTTGAAHTARSVEVPRCVSTTLSRTGAKHAEYAALMAGLRMSASCSRICALNRPFACTLTVHKKISSPIESPQNFSPVPDKLDS